MEAVNDVKNLKAILFGIVIVIWLYWLWQRRHFYRFALQFPGKWGPPLIGAFYKATHQNHLFPLIKEEFKNFNTTCIWLGPYPVIMTQDPEIIEKVLSSPDLLNKAKIFYKPFWKIFQGGILASPAKKWLHNRKLINPSFNHKVLINFFPTFNKAKNLALSKFDALVDRGEHKLRDVLQRITLGISVETTMGKVMKKDEELDEEMAGKWRYLSKHAMIQMILAMLNLDFIYQLNYRFWKTKEYLINYTIGLILQKINSKKQSHKGMENIAVSNMETSNKANVSIKKASNIFIDQAIKLYEKKEITWNDMLSESNTIVATVTMHPDIQEKLYHEIVCVFPEKNFEIEFSQLEQLPYLDMVINEVLRLIPSVPLIGRHVIKETQITKDILLPKDIQIIISIFHLHRRTDIWGPNAEEFNPENFLPENLKGLHPCAYMPFSKGARNCIGWRYALFSLKVLIVGFVRNYRFSTNFKYKNLRYVCKLALVFLEEPGIEIHRR